MEKLVKETTKTMVKKMFKEKIHIGINPLLKEKGFLMCSYLAYCNNRKLEIRNFHIFDKDSNSIVKYFHCFNNIEGNIIYPELIFENPKGLVIQKNLDFTKNKIFFIKNKNSFNNYDCYISSELMNFKFLKSPCKEVAWGNYYTNYYELIGNFENVSKMPIYIIKNYFVQSESIKLKEKYDKILKNIQCVNHDINENFYNSNFIQLSEELTKLNEELTKTFKEYKDCINIEKEKWDTSIEYIPQN